MFSMVFFWGFPWFILVLFKVFWVFKVLTLMAAETCLLDFPSKMFVNSLPVAFQVHVTRTC